MKTKALISFAVTAKLICDFVFVYAKSRFSHNEAHIMSLVSEILNLQLDSIGEQAVLCLIWSEPSQNVFS